MTVVEMERTDGMEEKENKDNKENLAIQADQDLGETVVLWENQESQALKEFRVLMERMVPLDCLESLGHKVHQEHQVSLVLREQWVMVEEMEPLENEEQTVLRVNEVLQERLVNQEHQGWRVDKVSGETLVPREAREHRDHLVFKDSPVHLVM